MEEPGDDETYQNFNASSSWNNNTLNSWLNNNFYNFLPNKIRNLLKPITLKSSIFTANSTTVNTTNNKLNLFNLKELGNINTISINDITYGGVTSIKNLSSIKKEFNSSSFFSQATNISNWMQEFAYNGHVWTRTSIYATSDDHPILKTFITAEKHSYSDNEFHFYGYLRPVAGRGISVNHVLAFAAI